MFHRIPAYYRTKAWKALRRAVLARDGGRCRYCGRVARQADHIIPRKRGGADALENLVACCAPCNKIAGGLVFSSFAAKKSWIRARRAPMRQRKKGAMHARGQ